MGEEADARQEEDFTKMAIASAGGATLNTDWLDA